MKRSLLLLIASLLLSTSLASTTAAQVGFNEILIKSDYGYAYGVDSADIDLDGDLDLSYQDVLGNPSMGSGGWLENDGNGNFTQHEFFNNEPGFLERHMLGDISGDGRPDLAIIENRDGHVFWYENNTTPGAGPWTQHTIYEWDNDDDPLLKDRVYDVALADLDGDSDLDAAVAGYSPGGVIWFENPGPSGWGSQWPRRFIETGTAVIRTIRIGDFNGDTKPDILATSEGAGGVMVPATPAQHAGFVKWYENPGDPKTQNWTTRLVDENSRAPIHGEPADIDGDGDDDILMAFGMRNSLIDYATHGMHDVAWYENVGSPGDGTTMTKYKIAELPYAFEAIHTDLDRDGDMDIAATAWALGDEVVWFENDGDPRLEASWTKHVVKANWNAANQVIATDINGDGWPDLVATADDGSSHVSPTNEMRAWINNIPAGAWNKSAGGDWDNATNWVGEVVPDGNDQTVNFLGTSSDSITIVNDVSISAKMIRFSAPQTYAVAGVGTINLEADTGNATLEVERGVQKLQIAVKLQSDTDANVADGATIQFNNELDLNGQTLIKTGLGEIAFNNDVISSGGTFICGGGICSGTVTFGGAVANLGGTVSPGSSTGALQVGGDFSQDAEGTLLMEIGGTRASIEHDVLEVAGELLAGGVLEVVLTEGFLPSEGDHFDLLDFASTSGQFAVALPALASGLVWDASALYSTGGLSVAAVPEPSALWFSVMACLVLVLVDCSWIRQGSGAPR